MSFQTDYWAERFCETDPLYRDARQIVNQTQRTTDEVIAKIRELYRGSLPPADAMRRDFRTLCQSRHNYPPRSLKRLYRYRRLRQMIATMRRQEAQQVKKLHVGLRGEGDSVVG